MPAQPPVQDLDEVLARLRAALPELQQRYPIARLGVFGSFARGEQRPDSDGDVRVVFIGVLGLEIVDLWEELKIITGKDVSMASLRSLKPHHQRSILPDVRYAKAGES